MAGPVKLGDFDGALRLIEDVVRKFAPRCSFYLGGEEEEEQRAKSPPYVAWIVKEGEPDAFTSTERNDAGQIHYLDDYAIITARCAGLVQAGQLGPDPRRQQLQASMDLMLVVSWAWAKLHQGYYVDQGWKPVQNRGIGDAYVCMEHTVKLRVSRWTPLNPPIQPTEVGATFSLEQS